MSGNTPLNDDDRLRDDSLLALAVGSDDLSGECRVRARTGPSAGREMWLREGIPARPGWESNCRPAPDRPRFGPKTPKTEAT